MMKIKYNISDFKRISYVKFFLIAGVLVLFSLSLFYISFFRISTTSSQFKKEKEELRAYREKIDQLKKRQSEHNKELKKIEAVWGGQRKYLNSLIDDKYFPYIGQLDQLEKILPGGVFVKKISLNTKTKDTVHLSIAAVSGQKLLEAYKAFLPYGITVNTENESEGLFTSSITIHLKKNEAK